MSSSVVDVWVGRNGQINSTEVLARKELSPYVEICKATNCVSNFNFRCNSQIVQIGKKGECMMFVEREKDD